MKQKYRYLQCIGALVIILGFSSIGASDTPGGALGELGLRLFKYDVDRTREHYQRVRDNLGELREVLMQELRAAVSPEERASIQKRLNEVDAKIAAAHGEESKEHGPQRAFLEGFWARAANKDKAADERMTRVAIAVAEANANQSRLTALGMASLVEGTRRLKYGLVGLTASSLLIMGAYFGLRHYYKLRPTIIERDDTSIRTMWEKLLKVKIPASSLSSLILDESLENLVKTKFIGIENAIKQGLPLSNMMFYGPAGTGKTMAAQEFARYLSELGLAEHVIIRGPAFKRLDSGNKAVEMLANILRWAKSSSKKGKKPVVLVFDEAETLFADREQPEFATKLTSDLVTTMTSFLGSAISTDVMFILSTNFPNRIDKALRNRIAKVNRVRFTLPGQKQREELLQLYLGQNFTDQGFTIAPAVLKNIKTYAANMEHLVGRDIQALTAQPLYTLVSQGKTELTPELLQEAIQDSMKGEDLSAY